MMGSRMKTGYLSRKEKIVLTTIDLIHEMGVSSISMKEIAKREGVTEASLYKHFKSKEELLAAVMDFYERYDSHIYKTLEENKESPSLNIFRYFKIYAEYYNNYREVTALIDACNVLAYDNSFVGKARSLKDRELKFITGQIVRGQEHGELTTEISPENLAYILLGSFDRIIAMWRWKEYEFSLTEKTEEIIKAVTEAFRVDNNSSATAAAGEKKVIS